ncbi:MAG: calcium-binding protein, partial [Tateyamaria sp.]
AFDTPIDGGEETHVATSGLNYEIFDATGARTGILAPSSSSRATLSTRDRIVDFVDTVKRADSMKISDVTIENIEVVNVIGSDQANDILLYQGGTTYIGGESISGRDVDTFVADFRAQDAGIQLTLPANGEPQGYLLENSVYVEGIEQGYILAGQDSDFLSGGDGGDIFLGGGGNDLLVGNGGNDILDGGAGSDQAIYDGFGYDLIIGGTERQNEYVNGKLVQNVAEADNLIIDGGTFHTRIRPLDFDGKAMLGTKNGIIFADADRADLTELAEISQSVQNWQYYTRTPGNNVFDASLINVRYSEFESVDVAGVVGFDDIIVYQNGIGYTGGEGENGTGEADLFVGDFRAHNENLTFDGHSESGVGYDIGQGTRIADFERFHVILGRGDDRINGGGLNDTVYAGGGRDLLIAGAGDDHFYGEEGNDAFEHTSGEDVFDGGAGDGDSLTISGRDDALTLELFDENGASQSALTMIGSVPTLADFDKAMTASADTTTISHGDSSVTVAKIEEYLISGSQADDVLIAGKSQGVLFGGAGRDALIGRSGNDFMSGGEGADVYVFGKDFGQDIIFGEVTGNTRLVFTTHAQADLDFSLDGIDLLVSAGLDTVRIKDYFADNGRVGLDFTFEATDGSFTRDFSTLGAVAPGARPTGRSLLGTEKDDVDKGTGKADVFRGFGGDDSYVYSGGGDLYDGGSGRDNYSVAEAPVGANVDLAAFTARIGTGAEDLLVSIEDVFGSILSDTLGGNQFDNALDGNEGDDTLFGREGNDLLNGGGGMDTLDGGADDDQLLGGDGNDKLRGGTGADLLLGGEGDDLLEGHEGGDLLDGGAGKDELNGGSGDDTLIASEGRDTLNGGDGIDTVSFDALLQSVIVDLTDNTFVLGLKTGDVSARNVAKLVGIENALGSAFDDSLVGNALDNRIDGNRGNDTLTGGAGKDVLDGGDGIDVVDFSIETGGAGVTVDLKRVGREFAFDTHGERDVLTRIEGAVGTEHDDILKGSTEDNRLFGLGGNDNITGERGNDTLAGGGGNDEINCGVGDDVITGGAGSDIVFGEKGDDLFIGGAGDDTYDGGVDDDKNDWDGLSYATITTGVTINLNQRSVTGVDVGNDRYKEVEYVIGSLGNDTVRGSGNIDHYLYVGGFDTYDGGGNRDLVSFELLPFSVRVDLSRSDGARTADKKTIPGSGQLRQLMELESVNRAIGTEFNDYLIGDALDNRLWGGAGNDVLNGGATADPGYDDHLFGGAGRDILIGAIGVDAVFASENIYDGGEGDDTIDFSGHSNAVNFDLVKGDGNDLVIGVERLVGGAGNDILGGSDGADTLDGGAGNNDLSTGTGTDLILYSGGRDVVRGGADSDTIDFAGFGVGVDIDLAAGTARTGRRDSWNDGVAKTIVRMPDSDIENAIGTKLDDRLRGNDEANLLTGGKGKDTLLGLGGHELVA